MISKIWNKKVLGYMALAVACLMIGSAVVAGVLYTLCR